MNKRTLRNNLSGVAFVTPSLICLIVFMIVPICKGLYFAFTEYNGNIGPNWVGLKNFAKALEDVGVRAALWNTVKFVLLSVPITTGVSLALASLIAMNFRNRFGALTRSILFIPVVCSNAIVASIWYNMFNGSPDAVVNAVLSWFGIDPVQWLGNPSTAFAAVAFVTIWKGIGYYLVIFYAAIMDVPNSHLEAADLDGASKLQQFFHIILPAVKPVTYTVITLNTINSFGIFDICYAMTAGGPGYATTTLLHRIYVEGFRSYKFGYASAIAMIMLVLVLVLTLVEKRVFDRDD